MKTLSTVRVAQMLVGALLACMACGGWAAREHSGGSEAQEDKIFKETLRARELALEKARQEFLNKQSEREETVTVKVRRASDEPGKRGEVIAEGKISREEFEKGDWPATLAKVKSEAGLAAPTASETKARLSRAELARNAQTFNWSLLGVAVAAGLGWWLSRSREYV